MLQLFAFSAHSLQEHVLTGDSGKAFSTTLPGGAVLRCVMDGLSWRILRPTDYDITPDTGELLPLTDGSRYVLTHGDARHVVYAKSIKERDMCFDLWCLPARGAIEIGRSRSNHIVYRNELTSAHHGLLQRNARGQLYYVDISTNGSYVNGEALNGETRELLPGDVLQIPTGLKLIIINKGVAINDPAERYRVALTPMRHNEHENPLTDVFVPGLDATYALDVTSASGDDLAAQIGKAEGIELTRGGDYRLIGIEAAHRKGNSSSDGKSQYLLLKNNATSQVRNVEG